MKNSKYKTYNPPQLKGYSSSHSESVNRKPDFLSLFPKNLLSPLGNKDF
jgi:hypothetical protein